MERKSAIDREKVIKGLNACARTDGKYCGACPYTDEGDCVAVMSKDVLELLKEQEPVKPTWSHGKPYCGSCGLRIHGGKFCGECGKPIAWEGR